jgi:thiol-disulfide isomerase/thioredoxin
MPVHVPLSSEAQAEARFLMLSANNLLKPANGRAVAVPTQDMVLGSYYLTYEKAGEKGEGNVYRDFNEANMAYENGYLGLHAPIKIRAERENYLKAEATQPGKMFVDFSGYTLEGASSKLSDYVGKGKYVLVDFWASWCGPCKGEIPNLIELQNKFGGDKFTVLGVNVWDDEAAFKAALTEEGITYPQIFIPQGNKDNATEMYGIQGIPQIILFAPDGTIVQRDLRGQGMKDLVESKVK